MSTRNSGERILLTGATGYIGGRLLGCLERAGHRVRCLARRPEYLAPRLGPGTEAVQGDCLERASLGPALEGIDSAFYLVHSMGSAHDFEARDRRAARNFGQAARAAGVGRIIYLGGLGDSESGLSSHLHSRQETGRVLRESGVPVLELRASIILGSGSLSFELIRALVERLPMMICPRWVRSLAQPIAVEDVIAYLMAALDRPVGESRIFEIGGADRVSYANIMQEYARQRGLRRLLVSVPVLTPRLSSLWLGLTTPVYARVGRKLIEGLANETVVRDDSALREFPIRPMGLRKAIRRAIDNEDELLARTRWSDALSSSGPRRTWGGIQFGPRLVDSRTVEVAAKPSDAFAAVRRIGGANGWYFGNWLWKIRGFIDLLVGGVGLRRGRRDPDELRVVDALDFWRVEAYEPGRRLLLAAEMKLPGRAWLEFEVVESRSGSILHQSAIFDPVGLAGRLYWYGIYPVHALVFAGLLRGIASRTGRAASS